MRLSILLATTLLLAGPEPALADDWSVPASWQIEQRELRFVGHGQVELVGTLHVPAGSRNGPAIVVTHGAGAGARDTALYQQFAELLPALGYAVFVYDRRGSGASGGEDPGGRHFETLAEDAAAALRAIAGEPEVDPARIGYWGLSQGGWIGMKAASRSEAAFVISVAAPLTTPGDQMIALTRNYMKIAGYDHEARDRAEAVRRQAMAFTRGEAGLEETRKLLEWAERQSWFEHLYFPPIKDYLPLLEAAREGSIMGWDPTEALARLEMPVLLMFGGEDFDIPVRQSLEILRAMPEPANVDVVVIPGADHLMVEIEEPVLGAARKPISDAPAYFLLIGHWLGELGTR